MPNTVRWKMIHWIVWKYPQDDKVIKRLLKTYQGKLVETDRCDCF